MLVRTSLSALMVACLFATASQAQSKEDGLWAINELSSELQQCSRYLVISSACMRHLPNSKAPALAADYLGAANTVGEIAFALAKSAGTSMEAFKVRMRLINHHIMKIVDNNCGNVSILIEWYGSFCKAILQDPTNRLKELTRCAADNRTLPCGDN
jgi:hypothetical protein